jgi:hypothetical protein
MLRKKMPLTRRGRNVRSGLATANKSLKRSTAGRNIDCRTPACSTALPTFSAQEVATMASPQPAIGDWYRLHGGALFEVVALDDDDGTVEIQYFDGTVEEMDIEDWDTQWDDGALEAAEAPEDWTGSVDVEAGDEETRGSEGDERDLRASGLDGIDLFE